jgi:hypothetical protein
MLEPHLAEKNTKRKQNSDTLKPHHAQRFYTQCYTEKTGEPPCCQLLAANLLGRCRPTGEQTSSMQYSHSYPGISQQSPLDRLTPALQNTPKNWIINKELKRAHNRGAGCTECTRERGRSKELNSM